MNNDTMKKPTTIRSRIFVKKNIYKMCAVIAFGMAPTMILADYQGCRDAGGGFWGCAWEAAKNDRIMPPRGGSNSVVQFKKVYAKDIAYCSKLPIKRQKSCISKGVVRKTAKMTKHASPVKSKRSVR